MNYILWQVYENEGLISVWYVINRDTKVIQSTWKSYADAKATQDSLNKPKRSGSIYDKRGSK